MKDKDYFCLFCANKPDNECYQNHRNMIENMDDLVEERASAYPILEQ